MRIVITTAGSRGDVAPYTGLARRLNAAGHTAVIATHEPFRGLVEALGIEFAGLAADPRELLGTEEGRRWQAASGLTSAVRMVRLMKPYAREMAEKTLVATEGADLILCSTLTAANYHVGQAPSSLARAGSDDLACRGDPTSAPRVVVAWTSDPGRAGEARRRPRAALRF